MKWRFFSRDRESSLLLLGILITACGVLPGCQAPASGGPLSRSLPLAPPQTPQAPPAPPTQPGRVHHLSEVAARLAGMSESAYDSIQLRWIGSVEPACNFFVASALCEDSLCADGVPDVLAAGYDTYLLARGWKQVDLTGLKARFQLGVDFDAVLQRDGTAAHGHVMIPVGLAANLELIVAQGELGSVTHQLKQETDSYLTTYDGGMKVFVLE